MFHTLLLNASFEPLRVISWQRAFVLVYQEKAEVLEEYGALIHSVSRAYPIPAVIKLQKWVKLRRQTPMIRFSRANVYARDEYRCQYCYQRFAERELTLDHVTPVVRGGRKTWENIVSACVKCNQRKSDKNPEEVGLKLLRRPAPPRWIPGSMSQLLRSPAPMLWEPYLNEPLLKIEKGSLG